ncbi:exported hypothetical protein [Mesorhizobium plurifarium]|uniref:Uncharacterized protein n=1 Tax=Mesorhizobium plurifarium TaxID=69974 RepID=A0A090D9X4_MESPL|nr:exported hypothetical protein [Mesorhizobium plurifarium]
MSFASRISEFQFRPIRRASSCACASVMPVCSTSLLMSDVAWFSSDIAWLPPAPGLPQHLNLGSGSAKKLMEKKKPDRELPGLSLGLQRRGLDAGALGCRCNEGRIVYPATRPSQPAAPFQGV